MKVVCGLIAVVTDPSPRSFHCELIFYEGHSFIAGTSTEAYPAYWRLPVENRLHPEHDQLTETPPVPGSSSVEISPLHPTTPDRSLSSRSHLQMHASDIGKGPTIGSELHPFDHDDCGYDSSDPLSTASLLPIERDLPTYPPADKTSGSAAGVGDDGLLSQGPMDVEVTPAGEGEGGMGDEYVEKTVVLPEGSGSNAGVRNDRSLSQGPMDFEMEAVDTHAGESEGSIDDECVERTAVLPQGPGLNAPAVTEANEMLHGDGKKGQHRMGVQTRSSAQNTRASSNSIVPSSSRIVRKRKCCPAIASRANVSDGGEEVLSSEAGDSRENAIDVDCYASLWQPTGPKQFVCIAFSFAFALLMRSC